MYRYKIVFIAVVFFFKDPIFQKSLSRFELLIETFFNPTHTLLVKMLT